jgi:hypothetical protein
MGAVAWNLVALRSQTRAVAYLDDASVHEQMVRFAAAQLSRGQIPQISWFPYLNLGSPQFLHYQSLAATITGLLGIVIGPGVAFRWSLYLLWALWPLSVYLAARWLGFSRPAGAVSAAMAPFLMSTMGVGYESRAYIWIGYGVWTQLWAMIVLPFAWAASWRAIRSGHGYLTAGLLMAFTAALHFETGYLACLPLLVWPLATPRSLRPSLVRAASLATGFLLLTSIVIVPLLAQRPWAAVNSALQGTPLVRGYGLPRLLQWLINGQLLDNGRLPVVTVCLALGAALALRPRAAAVERGVLLLLVACLLLASGPATLGPVAHLIPGWRDLFFRRFAMGAQLCALLLAGQGAAGLAQRCGALLPRRLVRRRFRPDLRALVALLAVVVLLAPAWQQARRIDDANAAQIASQVRADRLQGADVARLVRIVRRDGAGRVYAGTAQNWGPSFRVGAVPVFKYLERLDVDEVGYTLRTASLMSIPEYLFDERNPSDYAIFGVHYLLLPWWMRPHVAAQPLARQGPYRLWRTRPPGYLRLGRVRGRIFADRTDLGARSLGFLRSGLAASGIYPAVSFGGQSAAAPARLRGVPFDLFGAPARPVRVGRVVAERDALADGRVGGRVQLAHPAAVILSASYDPGWRAYVDGRRAPTRMVAPALVAVQVPAGTHRVRFVYRGYSAYPWLIAVGCLGLLGLILLDRRRRRAPGQSRSTG